MGISGVKIWYTDEELIEAIKRARGNLTAAANELDVSRSWIGVQMNERPAVKAAVDEARENTLDKLEGKLYDEALDGNITALIFALKTQGAGRGWSERQQIDLRASVSGGPRDAKQDAIYFAEVLKELREMDPDKLLEAGDSADTIEGEYAEL